MTMETTMTDTILYRPATAADGAGLDRMAQAVWMETFGTLYSDEDLAAYLAHAYGPTGNLLRDLADPAIRFQLATARTGEGDRIVGYAKVGAPWLPDTEPGAIQLSQLYVDYGWHGSGIAHALMDWTFDHARASGASALLLTVWEDNHRAIRFYEKRGFTHIGDYAFPVGEKIDRDLIMRLAL